MLLIALVLTNVCCYHNRLTAESAKIVNGIATSTNEWPWIVSLRMQHVYNDYNEHFCGGSIIRRSKPAAILTAAHCIEWIDPIISNMGTTWNIWIDINRDHVSFPNNATYDSTYDSYKMIHYVYHENITYDPYYENIVIEDVAVIFIDEELPETQEIIRLNSDIGLLKNGDDLIAFGYGADDWNTQILTDTLEMAQLKYINDTICNIGVDEWFMNNWNIDNYTLFLDAIGIEYGNMNEYPYNIILCEECVICAVGENSDSCNGDSGSPLIYGTNSKDAIQVGIVSFGFECNTDGTPAQYTDVAYYYQWIQYALNDVSDSVSCASLFFPYVCSMIVAIIL